MCGIAGFTGKPNKDALVAMTRQLIHRGPDDEGYLTEGGMNMGMRRLSIIDLQTGHQPIHNEDKTTWVTCNGEIYNFQSLRADLQKKGYKFYTHSDTEVLVHLYDEYGDDFLSHLNGMFAIALWDDKKKRLLLARDRLGVKPLYYFQKDNQIYYSSELKSFRTLADFNPEISHLALSHYLTFRNVPAPMTIYQDVWSMLPGELLIYESGTIEKKKYWRIDYSKQVNYSERDAEERILDLLKDAVRLRMISDVPVGTFLSGGVDSSLVTALMCEQSSKPVKTFSLAYEEDLAHKKDSYYARMVADKYGTEHHEYVMGASELRDNLENIAGCFDQPFNGVLATYFLTKLVKEHVTVALTGDGADDQFGSYAHHRLCWPIENYIRAKKSGASLDQVDFRPYEDRRDYVMQMAEEDIVDWRIKFYALTDEEKAGILNPSIYEEVKHQSSLDLLRKNFEPSKNYDSLNRLLDVDVNTLLPDEILVFADRLSMAHSIELRSPFLDYRFAELVATISGNLKIKNGIPKYILKKVASRYLPDEILYRPKEGFILPQDSWLHDNLKSYVQEILSEDRLNMHGYFNTQGVQDLLNGYFEKKHTNSYKVWNLIMFQIWFESVHKAKVSV